MRSSLGISASVAFVAARGISAFAWGRRSDSAKSNRSRVAVLATAVVAAMLTGCAQPGPYTAPLIVGKDVGVSIDAKQRVVFSHGVHIPATEGHPESDFTATCAEPSPDALTAIGVSNGLSLNLGVGPSSKAIDLTSATSESAAFIGLRTQSIQILRDQMYRLCEGYAGGAMDGAEFKAMQRRFQSTVLGLLAIEQLTGPVVASQALVLSTAQAHAGAGLGDATVTAAQQAVDAQRQKVTTAQQDVNTKQAKVDVDRKAISDNDAQIAAATDASTTDSLKMSGKSLQTQLQSDLLDVKNSQLQLSQERDTLSGLQLALSQAQAKSSASASSSGELQVAMRATAASTDTLAKSVREIVSDVNATYLRDECLELIARLTVSGVKIDNAPKSNIAVVAGLCTELLREAAQERHLEASALFAGAQLKLDEVGLETLKERDAEAAAVRAVSTNAAKTKKSTDKKKSDKTSGTGAKATQGGDSQAGAQKPDPKAVPAGSAASAPASK